MNGASGPIQVSYVNGGISRFCQEIDGQFWLEKEVAGPK